jgi:hypothetical protein
MQVLGNTAYRRPNLPLMGQNRPIRFRIFVDFRSFDPLSYAGLTLVVLHLFERGKSNG